MYIGKLNKNNVSNNIQCIDCHVVCREKVI